ncbi:transcriptional regulator, Crp/Fnr family [Carboxydocella sporoproducens DSM 16521]|uniref:Transcriptional regulator, Crp/Fnr family n=2 Tax=Carboxydocella TaxID=178898 RepID=A0A1T4R5D6_9FIRM|nr:MULTISPECIES: Crp/Fnr family transcriptional regulator [Carboxydocella]AVX19371.1 ttranscriptional regulator CooA, Crp/Fnr family [Carboxydocella thermautotrophica]AVX29784.1 transcriptional regulator CooA, Crp/Fnr family [Carboxydocella thermautotrophica]SKA11095.1 transcriptional regulator, Crp/Fnr family [Carboxydocella sporoproducens DSM 16521]
MPTRMRLTDINLLEVLSSPEYARYLKEFREQRFSKKAILFSPNDEKNLVFLVKSGKIRVYLAYEDKEFTLSILEAGDIYSTHTRAFTQAMEDTTILVTDVRNFKKIIAEFPAFGLNMVNVLGDLLKNSITIINGLVFKDTHLRLAEFLVQAAKDRGVTVEQGIKLELGLTTEEIALVLGATRQTVSVLLNDLRKSGILEKLSRRTILIKDLKRLQEISSGF